MKKALWWIAGVLTFVCLLAGLVLLVVVQLRTQSIARQKVPTVEDLDRLQARFEQELRGQAPEPESDAAEAPAPTPPRPSSLPWRLEKAPSREALAAQFGGHSYFLETPTVMKTIEAVSSHSDEWNTANKWDWRTGIVLLNAGEYEEARRYFYKGFEIQGGGGWCGYLAWVEPDPEKASRLLEMSCDDPWIKRPLNDVTRHVMSNRLANAVELARATDSKPLANHYLEQLRIVDPERARQYESPAQDSLRDKMKGKRQS